MKNYSEAIKIKHNMIFFFNEILAVDNLLINEHAPAEHQDGWNGRLSTRVTLAAYTHIIKDRIIMYFVMKKWHKISGHIHYCVFSLPFFR